MNLRRALCPACVLVVLILSQTPAAGAQTACDPDAANVEIAAEKIAAGNLETALNLYTCAIEQDPADYSAYLGRIYANLLSGRYMAAFEDHAVVQARAPAVAAAVVNATDHMITAQPDAIPPRILRSFLASMAGEQQRALADTARILELQPSNVYAHLFRGLMFQTTGEQESADFEMERSLELAPDSPDVRYVLAVAHRSSGQLDIALTQIDSALELLPDNTTLLMERATIYAALGDTDQARAQYDRMAALDPDNRVAYVLRGALEERAGNLPGAEADYRRALDIGPADADLYQRIGWIRLKNGDLPEARADFDESIALNPALPLAYLGRGTTQTLAGDTAAGADDFARYLTLSTASVVDLYPSDNVITLPMTHGLTYRMRLAAQPGQHLTATAVSGDGRVDAIMVLLGPGGTALIGNDDFGASGASYDAALADYTLPEEGTYILLISHAGGGSEGNLELSVDLTG